MLNLFLIGVAICILTFLLGIFKSSPYTPQNQNEKAGFQRILCIAYGVGFGLMTYDAFMSLGDAWWEYSLIFVFFSLSLGAFLEAKKPLPNSPSNYDPNQQE